MKKLLASAIFCLNLYTLLKLEAAAANAKANQEDMLTETAANKEEILARIDAMFDVYEKRTMACLGQTEANTEKIDPGMMQSVEEHQDVPREEVVVRQVKGLRKRRRVRKSTTGQRGEPKELTRGNHGKDERRTINF
jgi:hypothetical protein